MTSPCCMLPDELLIHIFDFVYASLDFLQLDGDWLDDEPVNREVAWMRIASVCRRWRRVILGTPKFWRIINVHRSADWLRLCLPLSKDAPGRASAGVYFREESFSGCLLEALSESDVASYIVTLSFAVCAETFRLLHDLFLRCLPNLTTLFLSCTDAWLDAALVRMSPKRLNHLTRLTLINVVPPDNLAQFNNLRVFRLFTPGAWVVSMDKLLDALDVWSSQLETLCLDRARSPITHAMLNSSRPPSSIIFPRLRKIHLDNPHPFNACLLSYLHLPSASDMVIRNDMFDLESEGSSYDVRPFSAPLPQNPTLIVPFLPAITRVELTALDGVYAFRGESDAHSLHLEILRDSDWTVLAQNSLHDILHLLSRADVRQFAIKADYDTFLRRDFTAVFKAFPNLESLRLNGENHFEYVLELLAPRDAEVSSTLESLFEEEAGASGEVTTEMLCPRLRKLVIGDSDNCWGPDEDLLDKILDILRARVELGTRLDRFEIHLMHEHEDDHHEAAGKYVPLLQELVDKVVYGNHEWQFRECRT